MMELTIKETPYKIQYGYNQFIDTDLMDRVKSILRIMMASDEEVTVEDVENIQEKDVEEALKNFDLLREVISTTRELLFVGCQKHNPLKDVYEAGDLMDECEGSVQELFMKFVNELFSGGFLGDLIQVEKEKGQKRKSTPKK